MPLTVSASASFQSVFFHSISPMTIMTMNTEMSDCSGSGNPVVVPQNGSTHETVVPVSKVYSYNRSLPACLSVSLPVCLPVSLLPPGTQTRPVPKTPKWFLS